MAKGNGALKLYKSYNFVDKDPVIDKMRALVRKEKVSYKEVEEKSGVKAATLHNWFEGQTKRPQYATIMAVARSLGYVQRFVKRGSQD